MAFRSVFFSFLSFSFPLLSFMPSASFCPARSPQAFSWKKVFFKKKKRDFFRMICFCALQTPNAPGELRLLQKSGIKWTACHRSVFGYEQQSAKKKKNCTVFGYRKKKHEMVQNAKMIIIMHLQRNLKLSCLKTTQTRRFNLWKCAVSGHSWK